MWRWHCHWKQDQHVFLLSTRANYSPQKMAPKTICKTPKGQILTMNTGAAVVAFAVTLFLKLYECFHVYHTSWLWWSLPGDANMPVRLVTTSSFDHREFFLSRLVIIVVLIQPLTVDIIIMTFIFIPLFKRFLDIYHISAAPVSLSKDVQEVVHQFVFLILRKTLIWRTKNCPKHVISKDAVETYQKMVLDRHPKSRS